MVQKKEHTVFNRGGGAGTGCFGGFPLPFCKPPIPQWVCSWCWSKERKGWGGSWLRGYILAYAITAGSFPSSRLPAPFLPLPPSLSPSSHLHVATYTVFCVREEEWSPVSLVSSCSWVQSAFCPYDCGLFKYTCKNALASEPEGASSFEKDICYIPRWNTLNGCLLHKIMPKAMLSLACYMFLHFTNWLSNWNACHRFVPKNILKKSSYK